MAGMVRLSLLVNLSEVRSIILKLLRMWLLVQLLNGSYNQKITKSTKDTFLIPLKSFLCNLLYLVLCGKRAIAVVTAAVRTASLTRTYAYPGPGLACYGRRGSC